MAHDYKNSGIAKGKPSKVKPAVTKKRAAASSNKPAIVASNSKGNVISPATAMSLGLGIGLLVAGYIYFILQPKGSDLAIIQPSGVVVEKPATVGKPIAEKPEEEPGQRFDFYSILPQLEVIIPEQEISGSNSDSRSEKNSNKPTTKVPSHYMLQAGSFRKLAEAERVRAELALLGVESHVETVTIKSNDTWHRVRIGPFEGSKKLYKIRNRLLDNSIDVMVLKVKS